MNIHDIFSDMLFQFIPKFCIGVTLIQAYVHSLEVLQQDVNGARHGLSVDFLWVCRGNGNRLLVNDYRYNSSGVIGNGMEHAQVVLAGSAGCFYLARSQITTSFFQCTAHWHLQVSRIYHYQGCHYQKTSAGGSANGPRFVNECVFQGRFHGLSDHQPGDQLEIGLVGHLLGLGRQDRGAAGQQAARQPSPEPFLDGFHRLVQEIVVEVHLCAVARLFAEGSWFHSWTVSPPPHPSQSGPLRVPQPEATSICVPSSVHSLPIR